jgi:hypothetical protein
MLYKPQYGKFKDNLVVFHEGRYYLFSMFAKDYRMLPESDDCYRYIWLAESDDGVHWHDVGPVIEDADLRIYAQGIHKVGDTFILNHGSFDHAGNQNTLKFYQSEDLYHWRYMGEESDLTTLKLDPSGKLRLDHMYVVFHDDVYYGYAVGVRGFLKSADGYRWEFLDNKIDFNGMPPTTSWPYEWGPFEVGGCREVNGIFYYLGGGGTNYLGRQGYSTCCLKSTSPEGPFVPDPQAYRFSGNSGRWVSIWARFAVFCPAPLITSYLQEGFSYEMGATWMPPLKLAAADKFGHLRMLYWNGNDRLIGSPYRLEKTGYTLEAKKLSYSDDPVEPSVVICPSELDTGTGVVITGFIQVTSSHSNGFSSSGGFFLEESSGAGSLIWLHGYGLTEIGYGEFGDKYSFTPEDRIDYGCAAPAGLVPGKNHRFRLLIRRNMFEFYLDDCHVQLFNTTHFHDKEGLFPKRLGFMVRNGVCSVSGLRINAMDGL